MAPGYRTHHSSSMGEMYDFSRRKMRSSMRADCMALVDRPGAARRARKGVVWSGGQARGKCSKLHAEGILQMIGQCDKPDFKGPCSELALPCSVCSGEQSPESAVPCLQQCRATFAHAHSRTRGHDASASTKSGRFQCTSLAEHRLQAIRRQRHAGHLRLAAARALNAHAILVAQLLPVHSPSLHGE